MKSKTRMKEMTLRVEFLLEVIQFIGISLLTNRLFRGIIGITRRGHKHSLATKPIILLCKLGVGVFLSSCNFDDCGVIEKYDSGRPKSFACVIDEDAEYYCYEEYLKDGTLSSKFCLKKGELHGEVENYYSTGILRSKCQYDSGLRQGACYEYNPKGKPTSLNFCVEGNTILIKSYKYDSSGVEVVNNFNPVFRLFDDTISSNEEEIRFEVRLPIPDSLIDQEYSIFKYGFKPLSLKDSIVLEANNKVKVYYKEPYVGSIRLDTPRVSKVFFGYLYDAEKNAVYNPKERVVTVISE